MNKNIIICTLAGLTAFCSQTELFAQEQSQPELYSLEKKEVESIENPWTILPNAAAIGFSTKSEVSDVSLTYNHESGDHHVAGQAGRQNNLIFDASMYQSVGELFKFSGHFGLNYSHQDERAYYDLLFPTENAYVFGAKRKGSYNQYVYDLNFEVATVDLNGWNFGFGLDYKAGDLSRILDPRPRVLVAQYQLTPSAIYTFNDKHRIGLSSYYRFEKQRLNNITSVDDDRYYDYFFSTGLDNAYATTDHGGIMRRYEDNIFGLDAQYGLTSEQWSWTTSVGGAIHSLKMIGAEKRIPGTYECTDMHAQTLVTLNTGNMLHSFGAKVNYLDGSNTAYVQDYVQTTDEYGNTSEKWITTFKNVTYNHTNIDASASYDLYLGDISEKDYSMKMGVSGSFKYFERKYLLPVSKHEMTNSNVDAYFGMRLYNKDNRKLWLNIGGGIVIPIDQTMFLVNNNEYAGLVLRADEMYYNRSAYNYHAELTYSFPLVVGKTALNAYVKAEYKQTKTEDDGFDYMKAALTFGILTF